MSEHYYDRAVFQTVVALNKKNTRSRIKTVSNSIKLSFVHLPEIPLLPGQVGHVITGLVNKAKAASFSCYGRVCASRCMNHGVKYKEPEYEQESTDDEA